MSGDEVSRDAESMPNVVSGESVRALPRQDSVTDQLLDVLRWATAAGCYDAADWIASQMRTSRPWMQATVAGDPITCDAYVDDGRTRRCERCGWWRSSHV